MYAILKLLVEIHLVEPSCKLHYQNKIIFFLNIKDKVPRENLNLLTCSIHQAVNYRK